MEVASQVTAAAAAGWDRWPGYLVVVGSIAQVDMEEVAVVVPSVRLRTSRVVSSVVGRISRAMEAAVEVEVEAW